MAPRHKATPLPRHDDFLSESESSASDSELSPAEGRYRDEVARSASAVALPPSRQGSYKDDEGSTASENEKKPASNSHSRSSLRRGASFDLGSSDSSDGETDEERLVGTGKKSSRATAKVKGKGKSKKPKRSWLMRSVGDGTATQVSTKP